MFGPASDQRHVDSIRPRVVGQRIELVELDVVRKIVVQVVFIFDLEQDHARLARCLVGDLVLDDDWADRVVPMLAPGEIDRIIAAEPRLRAERLVRFFERRQPLRITSSVPLRADVGAGTNDDIETVLFGHRHPVVEIAQIDLGKIVERRRCRTLAPIPGGVGLHAIKTGVLDFLKTVGPEFLRTTEIMESAAVDEDVLAVDGQAVRIVVDDIGMREGTRFLRAKDVAGNGNRKKKGEESCQPGSAPKVKDHQENQSSQKGDQG